MKVFISWSGLHSHTRPPGPIPRCMICHRDDVEMSCERCGSPIHGTCHFEQSPVPVSGRSSRRPSWR